MQVKKFFLTGLYGNGVFSKLLRNPTEIIRSR